MIIPLLARGQMLGALTFLSAESGCRYGPADLALAEELARRAAPAVDNARLYREAQEAIRARDDLLARAAHELRTPLTIVKGYTALLAKRVAEHDAEVAGLASGTSRRVDYMTRLITELLDATQLTTGQPSLEAEPIELGAVVAEWLIQAAPLAQEKNIALVDAVEPGLALVGDRVKLEQVVLNLLTNAIKHAAAGGTIRVEGVAAGPAVELRVRDTARESVGVPRAGLRTLLPDWQRHRTAQGGGARSRPRPRDREAAPGAARGAHLGRERGAGPRQHVRGAVAGYDRRRSPGLTHRARRLIGSPVAGGGRHAKRGRPCPDPAELGSVLQAPQRLPLGWGQSDGNGSRHEDLLLRPCGRCRFPSRGVRHHPMPMPKTWLRLLGEHGHAWCAGSSTGARLATTRPQTSTATIARWYTTSGTVRGPTPTTMVKTPTSVPSSANA